MDKKLFILLKSLKTGNILKKCGSFTARAFKCISISVRIQSLLFVVGCGRGWKIQCSFTKGAATREWQGRTCVNFESKQCDSHE